MDAVRTFNNELSSLYESKPPISRAKMTQITKLAIKAIKFYKHVVQSVEKFIQKCRPEYKVPGLYVIDSIVRQSRHQFGAEKDVFAPRFAKNVVNTFQFLFKCPPEGRAKIVRVLNLWQKNAVFTADIIQPLLDMANPEKAAAAEATIVAPSIPKQDKPADVKAWLSQAEPTPTKGEGKDETLAAVQQILQQTQQQQHQQQQLQQLQLLQQQLEKQKQATEMSTSSSNTGLVLDSSLVDQIQTLTGFLSSLTGKAVSGNNKSSDSGKPSASVAAPALESKALGFNKALLDFDYGDEEEEESRDTHAAVAQSKTTGLESSVQTVQRLTEELKHAQTQQEFLRQQLRHQPGVPTPPNYAKLMQRPPEPDAPPEPAAAPAIPSDENDEVQQMLMLQQEAAAIEEQQQRRHHDPEDQEEGEIVSSHKRSRHRDKSRSRSRSPKRRRSRSRSRSRSGSRSRSRSKRKKRSRSRSRSRRSKRSRSRDKHERRRERDEEERKREKEKRELERERERKGLPPLKEKHLSVCTKTLWVGRLPKFGAEHDLRSYLEDFGAISSVDLVPPRGCAYVCMENRLDAYKALDKLKRSKMFGSTAKIAWAPGRGMKEYKQFTEFWEVEKGVTYIPWDHLASEVDLTELAEGAVIDDDTLPPGLKLELEAKEAEESTKVVGDANTSQISQMVAAAVEGQPAPVGPIIPGLSLVGPNMGQPIPTVGHAVPNTLQAMPVGTRMPGPVQPPVSQPQAMVSGAAPEMVRMPVFQGGVFPPFMGFSPQMPPPGFRFPPGFQPPTTVNSPAGAVPTSGVQPPSSVPRGVPPPTSQPGLQVSNSMIVVTTANQPANPSKPVGVSFEKMDFKIPGLGGDPVSSKAMELQSQILAMQHQAALVAGHAGIPRPGYPFQLAALQRGLHPGGTPTSLMGVHPGQPGSLPPGFNQDIRLGMRPPSLMRQPGAMSQPEGSILDPGKSAKTEDGRPSSTGGNDKGEMGPPHGLFVVPKPPPTSILGKFKEPAGQKVSVPGMPGKKDVDMREDKGQNHEGSTTGANHHEGGLPGLTDQDKMGLIRPPVSQEQLISEANRFHLQGMRLMRPLLGVQGQPLIQRAVAPGFRMRLPGPGQQFAMQGQMIRIPNQGMQPGGPQLQVMGMRQLHPGMMGGSVRGMIPPQGIPTSGGMQRPGGMIPPGGGMPPPGGMLPQGSMAPPGGMPPHGSMMPPPGIPPNSRLHPSRANQAGQQETENREGFPQGMHGGPQIEGGRADGDRNQDAVPEQRGGRSRWGPPVPAPERERMIPGPERERMIPGPERERIPGPERERMIPERRGAPEPLMGKIEQDFSGRDIDMRERKWPERGWQDRDDRERAGIGMRDQDWRMPPGGPRGPDWNRDMDERNFPRPEDRDMRRPDFDREWKRPGDRDLDRDKFRPDMDRGREGERNMKDRDRDFGRGRDRDRDRSERDRNRDRDRDRDRDRRDRDRDRDRRDRRDDKPRENTKSTDNKDSGPTAQKDQSKSEQSSDPLLTHPTGQSQIDNSNKPSKEPVEVPVKEQTSEPGSALQIPSQTDAPLKSPPVLGNSSPLNKEPELAAPAPVPVPQTLNPLAEAFVPTNFEKPKAASPKGLYVDIPEAVQKPTPPENQHSESESKENLGNLVGDNPVGDNPAVESEKQNPSVGNEKQNSASDQSNLLPPVDNSLNDIKIIADASAPSANESEVSAKECEKTVDVPDQPQEAAQ